MTITMITTRAEEGRNGGKWRRGGMEGNDNVENDHGFKKMMMVVMTL